MTDEFLQELTRARLLAIIRGEERAASVAAALALIDEGFRFLEISLITPDALAVIAEVVREAPPGVQIGAGTVLTVGDVHRVRDAGGTFVVTPAVASSVAVGVRLGIPVIAGALTPTECVAAMGLGATAVKLFPASIGGPAYLKALRDPLPSIPFVPVGGIDAAKVGEYFAAGAAAVGLGGPLIGDATAGGGLGALRDRARSFHSAAADWLEH